LKRLCKELGLSWVDVPAAEYVGETPTLLESSSVQSVQFDEGSQSASSSISATAPIVVQYSSSVIFVGPAFGATKDSLLRQASAFILPSFSEGLPMSVLEAWSYRLPVLMTDACNLPEGFATGAALRIGSDVESITEGMRLLQESTIPDLQSIGQNGRALVERQFTWPMVAAQMKSVYEWVLGGGDKPGCVV
jgi:poly(glycerol-phosphate) alpha-glucosyltransferase